MGRTRGPWPRRGRHARRFSDRPADPNRAALDAAPAGPLALARRLRRSAHQHPRAADRRLTAAHDLDHDHANPATLTAARTSTTTRAGLPNRAPHGRRPPRRHPRPPKPAPARRPQPAPRRSERTIGGSRLRRLPDRSTQATARDNALRALQASETARGPQQPPRRAPRNRSSLGHGTASRPPTSALRARHAAAPHAAQPSPPAPTRTPDHHPARRRRPLE